MNKSGTKLNQTIQNFLHLNHDITNLKFMSKEQNVLDTKRSKITDNLNFDVERYNNMTQLQIDSLKVDNENLRQNNSEIKEELTQFKTKKEIGEIDLKNLQNEMEIINTKINMIEKENSLLKNWYKERNSQNAN